MRKLLFSLLIFAFAITITGCHAEDPSQDEASIYSDSVSEEIVQISESETLKPDISSDLLDIPISSESQLDSLQAPKHTESDTSIDETEEKPPTKTESEKPTSSEAEIIPNEPKATAADAKLIANKVVE